MAQFKIGLTMAGAISAGAYTAGVFDFLTEALDAWEERKKALKETDPSSDDYDIPDLNVIIPVISGASAGGMTGALGLVALADQPMDAVPVTATFGEVGPVTIRLPRIFDAWVRKPKLTDPCGGPCLLGTNDLGDESVRSLLDGTVLDRIALECVKDVKAVTKRPYLSENLHLFMTLSNLRGVPYDIGFLGGAGGQPGYPMMSHGDWAHFKVIGVGTASFTSPWADPYPVQEIDFGGITDPTASNTLSGLPSPWGDYLTAALATGAFPVGLPARIIKPVYVGNVMQRMWTVTFPGDPGKFRLPTDFPPPLSDPAASPAALLNATNDQIMAKDFAKQAVNYVAVDGGMINNEPFELARWTLMGAPPNPNPRVDTVATPVDRAVIMVDPFPERSDYDPSEKPDEFLLGIIKKIIPAMKNQARFKPDELAAALDESVYTRFLIAPRRRKTPNGPLETYPLACGLLDGFGGFLDIKFRAHDYQLGRRNCYYFLKDAFLLPGNFEVVKNGYSRAGVRQKFAKTDTTVTYLPIIPLYGSAATAPQAPVWPQVAKADVDTMATMAAERAAQLFSILKKKDIPGLLWRGVANAVWVLYGKSGIKDFVYWTVIKDLILRDQFSDLGAGMNETCLSG
ncbi:MAG: hypothetical protein WCF85_19930 [Rhodospirillaceae bacterium]